MKSHQIRIGGGIPIPLRGDQVALLGGALFAAAYWPFSQLTGVEASKSIDRSRAEAIENALTDEWMSILSRDGIWNLPSGTWTKELIQCRSKLEIVLELDEAQLLLCILAVRAAEAEFAGDWDEFCTVVPGALEWYPIDESSLCTLGAYLESYT